VRGSNRLGPYVCVLCGGFTITRESNASLLHNKCVFDLVMALGSCIENDSRQL
jgi:hypothetical protein